MGVRTRVSTRELLLGKTVAWIPRLAAISDVAWVSVLPSASNFVRRMCVARSRSPTWNQVGCPSCPIACRQKKVSTFTPQAQFAGQHVGDGIDVWGNIESPPRHVVAGVYDDGEVFGRNNLAQPIDKLGAASPAGKNSDHAALLF